MLLYLATIVVALILFVHLLGWMWGLAALYLFWVMLHVSLAAIR